MNTRETEILEQVAADVSGLKESVDTLMRSLERHEALPVHDSIKAVFDDYQHGWPIVTKFLAEREQRDQQMADLKEDIRVGIKRVVKVVTFTGAILFSINAIFRFWNEFPAMWETLKGVL